MKMSEIFNTTVVTDGIIYDNSERKCCFKTGIGIFSFRLYIIAILSRRKTKEKGMDMRMKYSCVLIAVKDMEKSLRFYKELFGQEVTLDLGDNKALKDGLVLQAHFDELAGFTKETMKYRSNTMELYFETEDFEGFMEVLDAHPEVERLHDAKTFPWLQRGIRIFDPDGHLIEVSESMYSVACGLFASGKDIAETTELIQHPVDLVTIWHEEYMKSGQRDFSVCGTDCTTCYCFGEMCAGCNACSGKVFHVPEGQTCAIYDCTVNSKGYKHCGECDAAPCEIWMKTRDPKFTDEEFDENVRMRMEALKNI